MSRVADSLYLPETEIARRVLPAGQREAWDGIACVLERDGLPTRDPLLGGRYWPAVKHFFDKRHGLDTTLASSKPDGMEKWECPKPTTKRQGSNGESEKTGHQPRSGSRAATS